MRISLKCRFFTSFQVMFSVLGAVVRGLCLLRALSVFLSSHALLLSMLMLLDMAPATVSSAACEICWFPERLGRLCKPTPPQPFGLSCCESWDAAGSQSHLPQPELTSERATASCEHQAAVREIHVIGGIDTHKLWGRSVQKYVGLTSIWVYILRKLFDVLPFLSYRKIVLKSHGFNIAALSWWPYWCSFCLFHPPIES